MNLCTLARPFDPNRFLPLQGGLVPCHVMASCAMSGLARTSHPICFCVMPCHNCFVSYCVKICFSRKTPPGISGRSPRLLGVLKAVGFVGKMALGKIRFMSCSKCPMSYCVNMFCVNKFRVLPCHNPPCLTVCVSVPCRGHPDCHK